MGSEDGAVAGKIERPWILELTLLGLTFADRWEEEPSSMA